MLQRSAVLWIHMPDYILYMCPQCFWVHMKRRSVLTTRIAKLNPVEDATQLGAHSLVSPQSPARYLTIQ